MILLYILYYSYSKESKLSTGLGWFFIGVSFFFFCVYSYWFQFFYFCNFSFLFLSSIIQRNNSHSYSYETKNQSIIDISKTSHHAAVIMFGFNFLPHFLLFCIFGHCSQTFTSFDPFWIFFLFNSGYLRNILHFCCGLGCLYFFTHTLLHIFYCCEIYCEVSVSLL